ncbi:ABC-2 type transport system permease protein [Catenuloplanes nepalensis]|uniref:Transport permease protein n=1 Tax=Catenuloplanes nepalensis TaxID=587533 RepID=A0ABT9N0H9_9ACTN|nr:ABC transporter permease [Catenuloplanes nepalensis]MDP9797200.1 ABC-2 type transport system permease protein [Catenuloplanes nepalensis]
MRPLVALTTIEAKLFARDGMSVGFGLLFPSLLLYVLGGLMPGFREPAEDMGGVRPIDVYVPVVVAMAIATIAISTLPAHLATHRERGVLRRMATTPVGPAPLLGAQLIVNLIAMLVSIAVAIIIGVTVLDVPLPASILEFTGILLLATIAMFAIGLLIAALSPNAKAASGIGMLVYFPMLFFAGVWTPGPIMPDNLRRIAEFTPLGAASQALSDAWSGAGAAPTALVVLTAYALLVTLLATRLFRWT